MKKSTWRNYFAGFGFADLAIRRLGDQKIFPRVIPKFATGAGDAHD
jgi:hypothetical protein